MAASNRMAGPQPGSDGAPRRATPSRCLAKRMSLRRCMDWPRPSSKPAPARDMSSAGTATRLRGWTGSAMPSLRVALMAPGRHGHEHGRLPRRAHRAERRRPVGIPPRPENGRGGNTPTAAVLPHSKVAKRLTLGEEQQPSGSRTEVTCCCQAPDYAGPLVGTRCSGRGPRLPRIGGMETQ